MCECVKEKKERDLDFRWTFLGEEDEGEEAAEEEATAIAAMPPPPPRGEREEEGEETDRRGGDRRVIGPLLSICFLVAYDVGGEICEERREGGGGGRERTDRCLIIFSAWNSGKSSMCEREKREE